MLSTLIHRYYATSNYADAVITYSSLKQTLLQCGVDKKDLSINALTAFFASTYDGRVVFINGGKKTRSFVDGKQVNTICIRGLQHHGPPDVADAVRRALGTIPFSVVDDASVLYGIFKVVVCTRANLPTTTPNIREIIMSQLPYKVQLRRKTHEIFKTQSLFFCNLSLPKLHTAKIQNNINDGVKHEITQDESVQDESVQNESVQDKSVQDKSVQDKSVQDKSVQDKSVQDESVQDESVPQDDQNGRDDEGTGTNATSLVQAFAKAHLKLSDQLKCPFRVGTTAFTEYAKRQGHVITHKEASDMIRSLPNVYITQNPLHRKYQDKYVMTKFFIGCDLKHVD